jgi:hypothetical protein
MKARITVIENAKFIMQNNNKQVTTIKNCRTQRILAK